MSGADANWSLAARKLAANRLRDRWKQPSFKKKMDQRSTLATSLRMKKVWASKEGDRLRKKFALTRRSLAFRKRHSRLVLAQYASGERIVTSSQKFKHDKGWAKTRWGKMYYDSFWEKALIKNLERDQDVVKVVKGHPVPYRTRTGWHTFVVDFLVKRKRSTELIEVKNPYLASKQKKKLTAAKIYCSKQGWIWKLITKKPSGKEK